MKYLDPAELKKGDIAYFDITERNPTKTEKSWIKIELLEEPDWHLSYYRGGNMHSYVQFLFKKGEKEINVKIERHWTAKVKILEGKEKAGYFKDEQKINVDYLVDEKTKKQNK